VLHNQGRWAKRRQRYQLVLAAESDNFQPLYRVGLIRLHEEVSACACRTDRAE
jgi:hypothetical protein